MEPQKKERNIYRIEILILYICPVLGVVIFFLTKNGPGGFLFSKDLVIQIGISLFLTGIYFLFLKKENFLKKTGSITRAYFLGGYFLSFFWLGLSSTANAGFFWFLLFLYLALAHRMRMAIVSEIFLLTEYVLLLVKSQGDMKQFVCCFVLANVSLFLFSKLRSLKEVPFLFLILLAADAALTLYLTEFEDFLKPDMERISAQIISIFALVSVGALYIRFLRQRMSASEKRKLYLERLLEPKHPLAVRLRKFSAALYMHSEKISILAKGAAESIGADELLAAAGGMYHEIGRINSKQDYISEGEKLGKDAGFPEELSAVIRQHIPTNELPESAEALVVMLSDSIITSGGFLKKNGKRQMVTDEQLVKNIIFKRKEQGSMAKAGVSEENIKKLEMYFINHIADVDG